MCGKVVEIMKEIYVNLKEQENLGYVIKYFKNKDLVSIEDIMYALDETLENIEELKGKIVYQEKENEEEFEETLLREKGLI